MPRQCCAKEIYGRKQDTRRKPCLPPFYSFHMQHQVGSEKLSLSSLLHVLLSSPSPSPSASWVPATCTRPVRAWVVSAVSQIQFLYDVSSLEGVVPLVAVTSSRASTFSSTIQNAVCSLCRRRTTKEEGSGRTLNIFEGGKRGAQVTLFSYERSVLCSSELKQEKSRRTGPQGMPGRLSGFSKRTFAEFGTKQANLPGQFTIDRVCWVSIESTGVGPGRH